MDNSKIYLYGKEVVTPYYLNEAVADKVSKEYVDEAIADIGNELNSNVPIYIIDDNKLTFADSATTFQKIINHIVAKEDFIFYIRNAYNIHNLTKVTYLDTLEEYGRKFNQFSGYQMTSSGDKFYGVQYYSFRVGYNVETNVVESVYSVVKKNDAPYYIAKYEYVKDLENQITTAIDNIATFSLLPVDILPTEDIKTNIIYAVPSENPEEKNVRIEYVYVEGNWEIIGTTQIDLSNYYTKAEIDALIGDINTILETLVNGE